MEIVLDASVLTDIWVKSRPRHQIACQLAERIKKDRLDVIVPMHAILELKCAIDNERQSPGKGDLSKDIFSETDPLKITTISIDNLFMRNYFDLSVPYMKAGDLPYVLIARKRKCYLVTEDEKQCKAALSAGVAALNIQAYLESL